MTCACVMVESRCAMMRVVLPLHISSNAPWISYSVCESSALVACSAVSGGGAGAGRGEDWTGTAPHLAGRSWGYGQVETGDRRREEEEEEEGGIRDKEEEEEEEEEVPASLLPRASTLAPPPAPWLSHALLEFLVTLVSYLSGKFMIVSCWPQGEKAGRGECGIRK
eukprot:767335-Hanusia_phi.AAC.3